MHRPSAQSLSLAVVLAGFLVLPMSMSGTSVALPQIGLDLHASGAPVQWIVSAYFLTASACMLVCGSLGDAWGRRRIYRIGCALFVLGSLGSALAPGMAMLLAARVVTGMGAAAVMAGGGALIGAGFTGKARVRAFAATGTTAGIGLAIGPTLSGWLVDGAGWRSGFAVFGAMGILLAVGTGWMRESRAQHAARLDWAGAMAFIAALGVAMVTVTPGGHRGGLGVATLVPVGMVLLSGAAFIAIERRAAQPILNFTLFRSRRFVAWVVAAMTMSFAFGGVLAFLPTYLQGAAGYTAAQSGLVMLMPTAPMLVMPLLAARLVNRGTAPRLVITVALATLAAGNLWLTILRASVTPALLLGPLLTLGTGMGLASGTIDAQAMNDVLPSQTGMVAGLMNTVRGTTQAFVLALFGAALIGVLTVLLGSADIAGRVATGFVDSSRSLQQLQALTAAWRLVLGLIGAVCAVGAAAVYVLLRAPKDPQATETRQEATRPWRSSAFSDRAGR